MICHNANAGIELALIQRMQAARNKATGKAQHNLTIMLDTALHSKLDVNEFIRRYPAAKKFLPSADEISVLRKEASKLQPPKVETIKVSEDLAYLLGVFIASFNPNEEKAKKITLRGNSDILSGVASSIQKSFSNETPSTKIPKTSRAVSNLINIKEVFKKLLSLTGRGTKIPVDFFDSKAKVSFLRGFFNFTDTRPTLDKISIDTKNPELLPVICGLLKEYGITAVADEKKPLTLSISDISSLKNCEELSLLNAQPRFRLKIIKLLVKCGIHLSGAQKVLAVA